MTSATSSAMARTVRVSGPRTRYSTGYSSGRPDVQALHATAHTGEIRGEPVTQSGHDFLANLGIPRHHDGFREIHRRELLNQEQEESRRSRTDVSRVIHNVWIVCKNAFEVLRRSLGLGDAGTFSVPEIDQNLGAVRQRRTAANLQNANAPTMAQAFDRIARC
jgi:hypothetical protein